MSDGEEMLGVTSDALRLSVCRKEEEDNWPHLAGRLRNWAL